MRIVFIGTVEFSLRALEHLVALNLMQIMPILVVLVRRIESPAFMLKILIQLKP